MTDGEQYKIRWPVKDLAYRLRPSHAAAQDDILGSITAHVCKPARFQRRTRFAHSVIKNMICSISLACLATRPNIDALTIVAATVRFNALEIFTTPFFSLANDFSVFFFGILIPSFCEAAFWHQAPTARTTCPLNAKGRACVRYASRRHLDRVGILYIGRSN